MPSIRKLAKEFRAKQGGTAQEPVPPVPAPPEPPLEPAKRPQGGVQAPEKGKTPAPASEGPQKHICGHESLVPVKKRELERKCPACRKADHEALMIVQTAKKAERVAALKLEEEAKARNNDRGRLPVGSEFCTKYVADGVWEGRLHVPTPEGEKVFEGSDTGLFHLQRRLDGLWRVHTGEFVLNERGEPVKPAPAADPKNGQNL